MSKIIFSWCVAVILAAICIISFDYRARENDTRLYNLFVEQLTQRPLIELMTPKWNNLSVYGENEPSPYVRDHFAGQFFLPVLAAKAGLSPAHALYVFNVTYRIIFLYLFFLFAAHFFSRDKSLFLLYSMQFMLITFNFLLRANHEPLILVTTLLAMLGALKFTQNRWWLLGLVGGLMGVFLTKGLATIYVPIFCVIAFLGGRDKPLASKKELVILLSSFLSIPLVVLLHEIYFRSVTGFPFFERYIQIQFFERTGAENTRYWFLLQKAYNFMYYFGRCFSYVLPWTLLGIYVLLKKWITKTSFNMASKERRFYLILISCVVVQMAMFSVSDRLASRYVFTSYYFMGALVLMFLINQSEMIAKMHGYLLAKINVHLLAALLWAGSIILALVVYFAKGGNNHWIH